MPICPEPGCGREMIHCCGETEISHKKYPCPMDKGRARWKCGATPDQHRIAALEAELAATRKALEARTKQLGVACTRHDLHHTLACGHCLEEAERALIMLWSEFNCWAVPSEWVTSGTVDAYQAALSRQREMREEWRENNPSGRFRVRKYTPALLKEPDHA